MRKRRPCAKPTLDSSARLAFTSPCRLRCLRSTLPHARPTFDFAARDGLHSTLPHTTAYIQHCRMRRPTFDIAARDGLHSTLPHATAYIQLCRTRRPTFDIAARDGLHSTLPHTRAESPKVLSPGQAKRRPGFVHARVTTPCKGKSIHNLHVTRLYFCPFRAQAHPRFLTQGVASLALD